MRFAKVYGPLRGVVAISRIRDSAPKSSANIDIT